MTMATTSTAWTGRRRMALFYLTFPSRALPGCGGNACGRWRARAGGAEKRPEGLSRARAIPITGEASSAGRAQFQRASGYDTIAESMKLPPALPKFDGRLEIPGFRLG